MSFHASAHTWCCCLARCTSAARVCAALCDRVEEVRPGLPHARLLHSAVCYGCSSQSLGRGASAHNPCVPLLPCPASYCPAPAQVAVHCQHAVCCKGSVGRAAGARAAAAARYGAHGEQLCPSTCVWWFRRHGAWWQPRQHCWAGRRVSNPAGHRAAAAVNRAAAQAKMQDKCMWVYWKSLQPFRWSLRMGCLLRLSRAQALPPVSWM